MGFPFAMLKISEVTPIRQAASEVAFARRIYMLKLTSQPLKIVNCQHTLIIFENTLVIYSF